MIDQEEFEILLEKAKKEEKKLVDLICEKMEEE